MDEQGYIDYFAVLGVKEGAKPGEVNKTYKRLMKWLLQDIDQDKHAPERFDQYLLKKARLNAAYHILANKALTAEYWQARQELIALEERWRAQADRPSRETDALRREFEGKLRDFLLQYVEKAVLDAGRDRRCAETSLWDELHERRAAHVLRRFRQELYQEILERLPFHEVTAPVVDWAERRAMVAAVLAREEA